MGNKADYISLINIKLPDGTALPSSQHRETMHTDENSIIELVYADEITDYSEAGSQAVTTPNSNFVYYATFTKVGNSITVTGTFTANVSLSANAVIFDISDTDFSSITERSYTIAEKNGNQLGIFMSGTTLKISQSILSGESFNYTINYTALN